MQYKKSFIRLPLRLKLVLSNISPFKKNTIKTEVAPRKKNNNEIFQLLWLIDIDKTVIVNPNPGDKYGRKSIERKHALKV